MVPGTKEAGLVETTVHTLVREATVLRAGIDTIEIDTKEEKYSKKKISMHMQAVILLFPQNEEG